MIDERVKIERGVEYFYKFANNIMFTGPCGSHFICHASYFIQVRESIAKLKMAGKEEILPYKSIYVKKERPDMRQKRRNCIYGYCCER